MLRAGDLLLVPLAETRRAEPGHGLLLALVAALAWAYAAPAGAAGALRVNGSTTVNPVVAEAAELLAAERGLEITVDTQGGSSGGIASLGDGRADLAMSSRPLGDGDRRRYPQARFTATAIGADAVALVVSRDVWEAGVRALTKDQVRGLYEGEIRNWSRLGGPDRRVAFFNKEPGRGTWEVFADWLYGDAEKAPLVSLPEVGANEEARSKVGATRGAITQLSVAWADGERTFALAIRGDDGRAVAPTAENLAGGRYPLSRPLLLVTDGAPAGTARELVDFLLAPRGQELVRRHGYLGLDQLAGTRRPDPRKPGVSARPGGAGP